MKPQPREQACKAYRHIAESETFADYHERCRAAVVVAAVLSSHPAGTDETYGT